MPENKNFEKNVKERKITILEEEVFIKKPIEQKEPQKRNPELVSLKDLRQNNSFNGNVQRGNISAQRPVSNQGKIAPQSIPGTQSTQRTIGTQSTQRTAGLQNTTERRPAPPEFKTREKTTGAQRAVGSERPSGTQRPINTQRPTTMQGRAGLQNTQGKRPAPPEFKTREKQVRPERPVKSVISEKPVVKKEENKKQSKNPVLNWFYNLTKPKQRLLKAFCVLLVLGIIFGSALGIFVEDKFKRLGDIEKDYSDVIYDEVVPEEYFESINGNVNASNFVDALKNWATTGNDQKMKSKNVVNVLLVGADSRQGTNTGNTDLMMLVSLNKKTKQIKLVSFMRDSYLYIEGVNSSYCTKLNAAFSMGGPEVLMKTIENNYKIEIDDFIMVNFESFKALVDAMGGVTVDVQKYEANYSNNRWSSISMPYGDGVTLQGAEALAFCRIRGCDADGDVSRTRRQRQVINAMIDKVKNASISDLNKYLNEFLPYLYTGFSRSQILSLGMKAITNGWASYSRSELQIPTPETRTSGSMGSWIWVVDYQLAAHTLQNELYGSSNITIEENRTTLIDIYMGTEGSGSTSGGTSSPVDKNDEVSTTVDTTEDVIEEITEEITEEDMDVPEMEDEDLPEEETEEDIEDLPEETTEEFIDDELPDDMEEPPEELITIGDDQ